MKQLKERLMVQHLRDFIEDDRSSSPIALIAGMRRIGKTTILKQLQESYPGAMYIDFSYDEDTAVEKFEEYLADPKPLLLLDEISFYRGYDRYLEDLYNSLGGRVWKGKVVITGSSPAHICKLANGKLGGGRAELFYLPPITFVEYLYFTDRIFNYENYDNVTVEDLKTIFC